jgi:hypothetical protein
VSAIIVLPLLGGVAVGAGVGVGVAVGCGLPLLGGGGGPGGTGELEPPPPPPPHAATMLPMKTNAVSARIREIVAFCTEYPS